MKVIVVGCTHAGTFAVKQTIADHPDADDCKKPQHKQTEFGSHYITF